MGPCKIDSFEDGPPKGVCGEDADSIVARNLAMGSCVDISRIPMVASAIANALSVDISDLPFARTSPEWMSEKAVSIGAYVIASGIICYHRNCSTRFREQ